jgi:hypothetical protein
MVIRTAQIFDLNASLQAKREAMDRVEANANEEWKRVMYELGVEVAKRMPLLITDDIYILYHTSWQTAKTHEERAMGPIMQRLAKNGIIRKSKIFLPIPSRRPRLHGVPKQIWESLVFW